MPRSIVISANSAWFLTNFRSGLISALVSRGFEVVAAANPDPKAERGLIALGCRFHPIPIDSKGMSPLRDLGTLRRYMALFRAEKPSCYLSSTIKPNIFGGLAARLTGVPFIGDVTGLGTAFITETWLTRAVETLYRKAFRTAATVFFHNKDDRDIFVARGIVNERQAQLIAGAGVDVTRFAPQPRPEERSSKIGFLMISRMLRDKGVYEYVAAAQELRRERLDVHLRMLGFVDVENRTAIARSQIGQWNADGDVEFLGSPADVRPHIAGCDCVVLPSYREGTAVSLLEAAAMAKPIVASDVPGCREVVEDGVNGFLCKPRDAASLAAAIAKMADLSHAERVEMGQAGRAKILREYDQKFVIDRYLQAIAAI